MRRGTPRDPALTLVLILLTCGIYYLYFIYEVSQETQEFLEEPDISPGVEVLLSVLTCGLWNIYWDYRMGKRIAEMNRQAGLPVHFGNALAHAVVPVNVPKPARQHRQQNFNAGADVRFFQKLLRFLGNFVNKIQIVNPAGKQDQHQCQRRITRRSSSHLPSLPRTCAFISSCPVNIPLFASRRTRVTCQE